MQPMLAKLPSLLLASKSKSAGGGGSCLTRRETTSSSRASTAARPPSSQSVAPSSASSTHRRVRSDDDGASVSSKASSSQHSSKRNNNQETHDVASSTPAATPLKQPLRPPGLKKKKKPAPQLSALEEVQRRKKMFSKWIKTAATASASATSAESTGTDRTDDPGVVLPLIHHHSTAALVNGPEAGDIANEMLIETEPADDDFRLPPLGHRSAAHEWEFLRPYEPSAKAPGDDETAADLLAPDLEDSLDEDEVNNLLNWTDGFPDLDDDDDLDLT